MNHDVTHCADYTEGKCPSNCYRGQLTKELAERRKDFVGIPISYASFKGTNECEMVYCPATVGGWVDEDWFCKGGERSKE